MLVEQISGVQVLDASAAPVKDRSQWLALVELGEHAGETADPLLESRPQMGGPEVDDVAQRRYPRVAPSAVHSGRRCGRRGRPSSDPPAINSATGVGQAATDIVEERGEVPAVLGDVEAGVVAQIDGRVPEVVREPGPVSGLGADAVAIGVQPPGLLGSRPGRGRRPPPSRSPRERPLRALRVEGRRLLGACRTAIWIASGLPWSASSSPKVALSTAMARLLRGVDPAGRC